MRKISTIVIGITVEFHQLGSLCLVRLPEDKKEMGVLLSNNHVAKQSHKCAVC